MTVYRKASEVFISDCYNSYNVPGRVEAMAQWLLDYGTVTMMVNDITGEYVRWAITDNGCTERIYYTPPAKYGNEWWQYGWHHSFFNADGERYFFA